MVVSPFLMLISGDNGQLAGSVNGQKSSKSQKVT